MLKLYDGWLRGLAMRQTAVACRAKGGAGSASGVRYPDHEIAQTM